MRATRSFGRGLANARVMRERPLPSVQAWEDLDALLDDARVGFLPEPDGVTLLLRSRTKTKLVGAATWTDAYLAAFADHAGLKLVTLDKGALGYQIEFEKIE